MTENPDGSLSFPCDLHETPTSLQLLMVLLVQKNLRGRRLVEALDLASCRYHLESYIPGITAMLDEARKEFCQ